MEVYFYGHAAFRVKGEYEVLFDPYLKGNPQAPVQIPPLNPAAILVTHGHGDHLGDAVEISRDSGALLIAPYELAVYCKRQGARVHPMHIGGARQFEFGWVKLTPAFHGSMVDEEGVYAGSPCGFLYRSENKTLYHAGDTGLFSDMQLIGEHDLDLALLPIGDNFVMGPEDAVKAVGFLRPRCVVPMHYNTFEVIRQDPKRFTELLAESYPEVDCRILRPGQVLVI